ncbi:PAS domain-containing protein [Nonomuraea angiospora]|uniref:PAS domain-containing protein n=1 Tax=Nonomuraea angiospora TaxID=46172 RepID=UPI0037A56F79
MTATSADGEPTFATNERAHAALVVELLGPVVPALGLAMGPKTEVVLHNLTTMPNTIAAIGGTLTGRDIGGPPTDLGLRTFKAGWTEHLIGYRSETADGLVMRSSSIFFHAPSGKSVVCLCDNTDIGDLKRLNPLGHQQQEAGHGAAAGNLGKDRPFGAGDMGVTGTPGSLGRPLSGSLAWARWRGLCQLGPNSPRRGRSGEFGGATGCRVSPVAGRSGR